MITRTDIINSFIRKYNLKSYLEIGVQVKQNFNQIKCERKIGVDPAHSCDFKMTSDEYFAEYRDEFDIIFIDGLHTAEQAYRDIINSLKCITDKGIVIVHDCNPMSEYLQRDIKDFDGKSSWCGGVWKAFAQFRMNRPDLECYVINRDYGVGIIHKGSQQVFAIPKTMDELDYAFLNRHRKKLLSLREPPSWITA